MRTRAALSAMLVAGALMVAGLSASSAQEAGAGGQTGEAETTEVGPRFKNVTRNRLLPTEGTRSWGQNFVDYDRDGYPDLLINRHMSPAWLFRNDAGWFTRHEEDFTPRYVDRHNCAWGEANGDRRPDLYCTAGAFVGEGTGPNQLYLQTRRGRFRNRARMYKVKNGPARGRSVNWIDYDKDGRLDLYVGSATREGYPNVLYRNEGDVFRKVPAGMPDPVWSITSTWTDWNQDGWPDLLLTQNGPLVAYQNTGGSFTKVDLPGVPDRATWRSTAWGDFDGDGWPDLHLVNGRRSVILRNTGGAFVPVHETRLRRGRMSVWLDVDNDGRLDAFVVQGATSKDFTSTNRRDFMIVQRDDGFQRIHDPSFRGPRRGNGDSAAAADFDRDGRVDVFVSNGEKPKRWRGRGILLRNKTPAMNHAAIELRGPRGNPFGFGARVRVDGAGIGYWRYVTDEVSQRVQSDAGYLNLGLGSAARATVRIEWPNGKLDCLSLHAGQTSSVAPGSRPCV